MSICAQEPRTPSSPPGVRRDRTTREIGRGIRLSPLKTLQNGRRASRPSTGPGPSGSASSDPMGRAGPPRGQHLPRGWRTPPRDLRRAQSGKRNASSLTAASTGF